MLVAELAVRCMLVYVDRKRTTAAVSKDEYVYRMNKGIKDALACGVPQTYVDEVMRTYISESCEDDSIRQKAEAQAKGFKDESGVIPDR